MLKCLRGAFTKAVVPFRTLLSSQIEKLNELAAGKPKPHVLSLACGHVREEELNYVKVY